MSDVEGDGLRLRRADEADADFIVALLNDDDVAPFLAASRPRDHESVLEEIRASQAAPHDSGVFVIEVPADGGWARAGMMEFWLANRRIRIAGLGGLAVHPDFRGRRLADDAARLFQRHLLFDLGFHRLELECYGFNERAIRHAERAGFVREGVKRKAYERHGEWVDGVLFGLVREDLDAPA
jgi:RimJ/RimL family protein N-acetyltransferase